MLTKNEISTLSLSPTKKDFVQIWNELLEVAGKLSERWDPTSTNESDPGIVILKALTGIADKLNYNIDKNTLEAFMPTAAQEDSMRKLCDMLGYNIKYYRSAETEVTIKYHNSDQSEEEKDLMSNHGSLEIPKFTVITNSDKDISYFTTNEKGVYISDMLPSVKLPCMEGQIVKCESTTDNGVITAAQISENNRFYLPETQIAENGIFVYNASVLNSGLADSTSWKRVDNLNIQSRGARVFKFGYDSYEGRPYIEFPVDYRELINDGLFIYYARTSGANGNVSSGTLTQIELPTGGNWSKLSADSFSVENAFAATTGSNIETIRQAYNNFKKTVGTFETLVTCRDYMNKIYTMMDDLGKPYVSNILVTDIRNDLNRAVTICSCDDAGIFYKETPLTTVTTKVTDIEGEPEDIDGKRITTITRLVEKEVEPAINHFDLVFYPFKSYSQIRSLAKNVQEIYDASFNYSSKNLGIIQSELADVKTIAHNIISPRDGDIVSINNYLRLNAIVGTHSKITTEEAYLLREKIKIALANAFNMRELDFGEEIPFESIVDVIEHADSRIKVVSLNEPDLYTTFSVFKGKDNAGNPILKEYAVASDLWLTEAQADKSGRFDIQSGSYTGGTFNTKEAKEIYNKLVVRNILAGRVPLFNYNTAFIPNFAEGAYRDTKTLDPDEDKAEITKICDKFGILNETNPVAIWSDGTAIYTAQYNSPEEVGGEPVINYTKSVVPEQYSNNVIAKNENDDNNITEITTSCEIKSDDGGVISDVTLEAGEFVKFRAPNYRTTATYPAYVNYRLDLAKAEVVEAANAEADTLFNKINQDSLWSAVFEDGLLGAHKKTFTLSQKVKVSESEQTSELSIENLPTNSNEETPEAIFKRSGCVRLVSPVPTLKWADDKTTGTPMITVGSGGTFALPNFAKNELIPNIATLGNIRGYVDSTLEAPTTTTPKEDFIISFSFEYIPFEVSTLLDWEKFVLAKFTPATDTSILWRIYGDGYANGKYILDGRKLLPFNSNYFGLLDNNYDTRLHGVYVATSLGNDSESNFINNNEEYELKTGDSLYIEYTPSATDEGTTQESVKKVYGEGTIIRPNGFEEGLKASGAYELEGHAPFKTVAFSTTPTSSEIKLHSLGTNEQIEIRELSVVTLNKDYFDNAGKPAIIYVYKNFDCPELENGSDNPYTLKDGEYIFYTGQDKTEFAYYGAGTAVTISGRVHIEKRDIIELSTIFDSGIQEIPWQAITLANNDSITFQEYQYVTLGAGDTINSITGTTNIDKLDGNWQYCDNVYYTSAGATTISSLPKINVSNREGNGWEVCSVFEISTSPSMPQVIRNTDKVETQVTLHKISASGTNPESITISASENAPLSFKSNIACQSNNGKVKLSELYTNTEKLKSFEFKVFSEQAPSVIKTKPDSLVPLGSNTVWETEADGISQTTDYWNQTDLEHIIPKTDTQGNKLYERALKLSVSTIPGTYGIFSIYCPKNVNIGDVWLELLPGVTGSTVIELFNTKESAWSGNKFMLKPGLNCIRVAKTCDIFMKAGAGVEGTLYFDNLRLVNTKVDTTSVNDAQNPAMSHGLNLSQLGYLPVSDESEEGTFNIFNMRARTKLKMELTNKALADIDSLEKMVASELAGTEAKAKKLEAFTESLVADISAMKTISSVDNLLTNYKNIYNDLENELDLKEALDKNEDVTDQLAALAKTFVNTESEKQEFLNKLADLKATTNKKGDSFNGLPEEELLADFTAAATSLSDEEQETLVAELKYSSLEKINSQYDEQLAPIIESLNNITEANATEIENIINNLYARDQVELFNQIAALFEVSKNNLSAGIAAVSTAAAGEDGKVNYPELAQQLEVLREQVLTLDINTILSKIDLAATEKQYKELVLLVEQLKTLLAAEDTLLIQAIDALLVVVRAKTGSAPDASITEAITKINTQIIVNRSTRISTVLKEIKTIVDGFTDYDTIMSGLSNIVDEQNSVITGRLTLVINRRTALVTNVNSFTNITNIDSLPFGTEAVAVVWPKYMKLALINTTADWYSKIRAALTQQTDTSELTVDSISSRLIIKQAANIEAFQELFERAKNLKNSETQNDARYGLVMTLSGFNTLSNELSEALDSINENDVRNTIICGIISELQTAGLDVIKKQRLFKALAEELEKEIALDTKLVNIAAKLLCPSVLAFEEVLPEDTEEDAFYQKARDYISGLKDTLIVATNISNWCDNNSKSEDDLKTEVFPDTYLNNRTYQQELRDIKECALLDWLTKKDLKVAWQMPTGNWVDRYGKEFDTAGSDYIKNIGNVWKDKAGNDIKVYDNTKATWSHYTGDESKAIRVTFDKLASLMNTLLEDVSELGRTRIPDDYKKAHGMDIIALEKQLLEEIRTIDKNRDFYYNVPVEANMAIDFNEGNSKLNTLMNPALNYDINNVNNSFVISKLDINYLDEGIQIARSSRT